MAIILNIESTTPVCSVAISKEETILAFRETSHPNSHSAKLSIFIQECIEELDISLQEIDAVAVSSGPGSYTGLRIGYSTAKGICYSLDKPLLIIDTLEVLARKSQTTEYLSDQFLFCPMIDARRMEVYTALYDHQFNKILHHQALILETESFGKFFAVEKSIIFSGNGAFKVPEVIQNENAIISEVACSAKNMPKLSSIAYQNKQFADVAYSSPLYIKSPYITKPKKRL